MTERVDEREIRETQQPTSDAPDAKTGLIATVRAWRRGRLAEHHAVAEYRAAWRVLARLQRRHAGAGTSTNRPGGSDMHDDVT